MLTTLASFVELIVLGLLILGIGVHAWYIPTNLEQKSGRKRDE